jgi:hypothetical protein
MGDIISLPPVSPVALARMRGFEDALLRLPQAALATQHVFHAGVYARTIKLVRDQVITSAFVKRATLLIVQGAVDVFHATDDAAETSIEGYAVIPACAGRKQVFVARGDTYLTMLFATSARTVEEAEREFTDEYERLASHAGTNEVIRTGE